MLKYSARLKLASFNNETLKLLALLLQNNMTQGRWEGGQKGASPLPTIPPLAKLCSIYANSEEKIYVCI